MADAHSRLMAKAEKQGPCFLCGPRNFARHRLWDAIDSAIRLDGWSDLKIARNWSVTVQEVRDVREAFAAARKAHRALPGRALP